ncbi:ABC transporter substrate-binding protein [Pseudoclavibacter chungangensis]|uniref:ABC transporter substrate-binding protein n=1 Tax=Pseudoclavibacter chungangensis TaxID=587635 RepID=A0A7J5BRH2_9MICO|nr:ABC transporter substrate-binding protein [Pseudoclavibacter chungangensis]KAB1656824.1 ABC transporter substrate-binding protein [Pseudoclavibacter chungangensis]NYJ67276.1 iron complex transport system substrate-binding protein [Pseudoclavibacter chungangensis]
MTLPRILRRFRRQTIRRTTWIVVAASVVTLLWVNGFHNIGAADAGSNESCVAQPEQREPQPPTLPDVTSADLPDPRTITGPSTAYTQSSAIPPISSAASAVQQLPATVTSSDGPETTVTDTSRILALNQNGGLAAAVIGLGFGCNLVGRDTATDIEKLMPGNEQLPLVTQNGHELSAEAILELAPTVVVSDTSVGPYDVQLQLREAGIPVVMIPIVYEEGVDGVGSQIQLVADALGVPELGRALADRTQREIGQTVQALAAMSPSDTEDKPRTVLLYLRGSIYYWLGAGSGADSIIRSIGARDVATEVGFEGMAPTNAEALVQAAPDVIIVMTLGLASVGGLEAALELPGIKQTPAGANQRIVDMSDYEVMSFGPRTASVLAALGTAIYAPELAYTPEPEPTSGAKG